MTVLVATTALACGPGGTGGTGGTASRPGADLDEVLFDRGYGKRLVAMDVRTCATRDLPIVGRDPVAFTRDHKLAATLRRIDPIDSNAKPSRLAVGPAAQDERDTVWTVGDGAPGGMAFDPAGERIALGLQRTTTRGGNISPEGVDDGLWIVDRTGERRRQLVPGGTSPFAWSPDGEEIASVTRELASDGSTSTKVWIVDVKSRRRRTVTTLSPPTGADGVLDWSTDGTKLLLVTWTTGPSEGRTLPNLEQVDVADGRRTPLVGPAPEDRYQRGVYSADGGTVIAQRIHIPIGALPQGPPYGLSPSTPFVPAPDRRTADLVSVSTDGTDLRSLCPTDPDDTLLDWH